jgi:hypothetical protein
MAAFALTYNCLLDDTDSKEDWVVHEHGYFVFEWLDFHRSVHKSSRDSTKVACTSDTAFTLTDLASLLGSLPEPDDEYWNVVEEITKTQSPLSEFPWES